MSYPKKPADAISLMPSKLDGEALVADGNAALAPGRATGSGGALTSAGVERVLHYDVQTKLGEGGMGVVYRALDQKLNRLVALKFLPPQIDRSDADLQRFLQEANALSALNHPHIATIYTVETTGEQHFLVLEYLPGGTLKAKLQQTYSSGAVLSIEDVLKYAQQTAEGLAHAHARGIIHRDVKTSNLMLTKEGDVKITDFGVAKLSGSSLATVPGSLLGTIAYMSPEQALGTDVDARSDVFSFGVVLFELISGRLPFEAPNDAALLTRVVNGRAPELKSLRADAPWQLEKIVGKALKKRLEERYATMGELLTDIREARALRSDQTRSSTRHEANEVANPERSRWGLGVVAAIAAALLAGALFLVIREVPALQASVTKTTPPAVPAKLAANRLAVSPFQSFGQEQGKETFSKDLRTELTNKLILLEQTEPSFSLVSQTEPQSGNGPTLVLKGTVIQDGHRLIVTVSLADAQNQSILNAVDVEGSIDQIPSLHQSLAKKVTEMLQVQVSESPRPRELYFRGRGYLERYDRMDNLEAAIAAFDKALLEDRAYALAYAGRAEAYLRKYRQTKEKASLDKASESVATAMQLDDRLAPVHFSDGLLKVALGKKLEAIMSFKRSLEIEQGPDAARELANAYDAMNLLQDAELEYQRAIELRKGYWLGYKDLAVFYQKHGGLREALPLFELVVQLAPESGSSYRNLGGLYSKLARYSDATDAYKRAVEIDPSAKSYYCVGTSLYNDHRYLDAVSAYKKAVALEPTNAMYFGALGDASRRVTGMEDVAVDAYNQAVALREEELKIRPRDAKLRAEIASWSTLTDKKRARREIGEALRLNSRDNRVQALAAVVYEQLDRRSQAIAAVEKALALGYSLEEIRSWPPLEKLRQDARYKRIVAASIEGGTLRTSEIKKGDL